MKALTVLFACLLIIPACQTQPASLAPSAPASARPSPDSASARSAASPQPRVRESAFAGVSAPERGTDAPPAKPDFAKLAPIGGPLNILIKDGNRVYRLQTAETPAQAGEIVLAPDKPESWPLPDKPGFRQGAYELEVVFIGINGHEYYQGRPWNPDLNRVTIPDPDDLLPLAAELKAELQPLAENQYYLRTHWPVTALARLENDVRRYNAWPATEDQRIRHLSFDSLDAARMYAFHQHLTMDPRVSSANLVEASNGLTAELAAAGSAPATP